MAKAENEYKTTLCALDVALYLFVCVYIRLPCVRDPDRKFWVYALTPISGSETLEEVIL